MCDFYRGAAGRSSSCCAPGQIGIKICFYFDTEKTMQVGVKQSKSFKVNVSRSLQLHFNNQNVTDKLYFSSFSVWLRFALLCNVI
jgi:hypothetical protein